MLGRPKPKATLAHRGMSEYAAGVLDRPRRLAERLAIGKSTESAGARNDLVSCVISSLTVWDDGACHHQLWRSPMRIG